MPQNPVIYAVETTYANGAVFARAFVSKRAAERAALEHFRTGLPVRVLEYGFAREVNDSEGKSADG